MSEVKACATCRWHTTSKAHHFTGYEYDMHLCTHPKLTGHDLVTGELVKSSCVSERREIPDPIWLASLFGAPHCGTKGRYHQPA